MFLYVEGQLIQYFCFECTRSKYIFHVLQYACCLMNHRGGACIYYLQYVDNILGKMLSGLRMVEKWG